MVKVHENCVICHKKERKNTPFWANIHIVSFVYFRCPGCEVTVVLDPHHRYLNCSNCKQVIHVVPTLSNTWRFQCDIGHIVNTKCSTVNSSICVELKFLLMLF